jgi:hypothetical protein
MYFLLRNIRALAAATSICIMIVAGCCGSGQCLKRDRCTNIAPGALPDPAGDHVHRFEDMQTKNGEAISFVIFLNEWYMGGMSLGPYGGVHLQQIAQLLPGVPYAVIIQPSLDPNLNELRRTLVVERLLKAGIENAEVRVRLEYPQVEGVIGDEAPIIYRNMLRSSQQSGQGTGAGTNLSGGIGGFGTGGAGIGGLGAGTGY